MKLKIALIVLITVLITVPIVVATVNVCSNLKEEEGVTNTEVETLPETDTSTQIITTNV